MGIVVGYFVILGIGLILVLQKLREERRAYLVSAVEPLEPDSGPPLSPVLLRVVLALVTFATLVDLILISFLIPPMVVAEFGETAVALPGMNTFHFLLNFAFDIAVIRIAWSSWRYRRGWQVAGIVVSLVGLLLAAWIWISPQTSLARWAVRDMVVSQRGELLALGLLLVAWIVLAGLGLVRGAPKPPPPVYRDEELAHRSEPLEPAERVKVRWARGEASSAELESLE